jgi:glycosyltransferase involved in cell wall biosynthesis
VSEGTSARTTVVIPVWDRYVDFAIEDALPSLLAQGLQARILLVDNASAVGIPETPGVELVRSPRRLTLGGARNLGLEHVRTPYVIFWDADDVMLPGTLELLEGGIESSPELAAFAAGIVEASGARHRWPRRWVRPLSRLPRIFSLVHCIWSLVPSTGSTIIRSELLAAGGGFGREDSGDDWVAGVSLVFRGSIGWSTRPGRVYRVHDASIWARHMTMRHQVAHARGVRERIRIDPGIPAWMRVSLPLIALGQSAAIGAHAAIALLRRMGWIRRADR